MSLWADSGSSGAFGGAPGDPAHLEAVERLKDWTRERFDLSERETIVVTEGITRLPGFPPEETHVAFWIEGTRHHFRIFKPVTEVAESDVPPAFMKAALTEGDGVSCSCC